MSPPTNYVKLYTSLAYLVENCVPIDVILQYILILSLHASLFHTVTKQEMINNLYKQDNFI